MELQHLLTRLVAGHDLAAAETRGIFQALLAGLATPAQVGALLTAFCMKGETVEELTAAAALLRELAEPVPIARREHLVDTCGTGGDARHTFNISTAAALVAAAAGARVAKHGNRSVSSRSGSADVLEAAGVRLDLDAAHVGRCVDEVGIGFLFAPMHHSAARHVSGPRRELGIRTIFNLLGPLTNPAGAPHQVLGVFASHWLRPVAAVLRNLGADHVLVVHSADGLDEISIGAETQVVELHHGEIREYTVAPETFGVIRAPLSALYAPDAQASLEIIHRVLEGEPGPARDIVCLNAGAALYAAGVTADLGQGVARARAALDNGAAKAKLSALVAFTHAA